MGGDRKNGYDKERKIQMDNSFFETLAVPLPEDIEKL